jgi:hypothetical protein
MGDICLDLKVWICELKETGIGGILIQVYPGLFWGCI